MKTTCECGHEIEYERVDIKNAHFLLCGDSTKKEDVEKLMGGEKADMVFTDPPYGMKLDTDYSKIKGSRKLRRNNPNLPPLIGRKWEKVKGDEKEFNPEPYFELFKEIKEQFWWGADYYCQKLPKGGGWFVWDKRTEKTDMIIGNTFELCWSKQPHKREVLRKNWIGILGISSQDAKKRLSPTQKPLEICNYFIEKFSKRGQNIIDLFGGSGSTLIACEQLNRKCFMAEISEAYCEVIIQRWEKLTNKKAKKL